MLTGAGIQNITGSGDYILQAHAADSNKDIVAGLALIGALMDMGRFCGVSNSLAVGLLQVFQYYLLGFLGGNFLFSAAGSQQTAQQTSRKQQSNYFFHNN